MALKFSLSATSFKLITVAGMLKLRNGILWCPATLHAHVGSMLVWLLLVENLHLFARNDLLWKQRVRSVRDVVTFANLSLDQWLKAQGKGNIPLLSPLKDGDGSKKWVKPTSGIKLNIDATIFDHSFKHGFGCVVRNTNGDLVAAFAGVKHGKVSPELAEIMGIREALNSQITLTELQARSKTLVAVASNNVVNR
ncbi:hypothetical protein G4B88_026169 [Cannabis sativa]|uniref:RNase H type-1 domain-containing protein n=1 Tax=Cannabis sativa TaxID=3483 RepID=A0A7J6HCR0_CANSA|nr:hypothetical protein G4B88_026169 [Cannabis sativa]